MMEKMTIIKFRVILVIFEFALLSKSSAQNSPIITEYTDLLVLDEDVKVATFLDHFNVTDPDGGSVTSCSVIGSNGDFYVTPDPVNVSYFELYVKAGADLDFDKTPVITLVIECEDDAQDRGNVTISVNIIPNQPPTIVAPTSSVNIGENEVTQRVLYTISVSDSENDTVSCDLYDVQPNSAAFDVWRVSTDYQVYLLDNPTFNYDAVSSYTLTLICKDDFGNSTVDLVADIIPNSPPVFDNLPTGTIPLDASTTILGYTVFTVQASDNDSLTLSFSLDSTQTTPDLFEIDAVSGEITTTKDLTYAVNGAYQLEVKVSDGALEAVEYIIVDLTNVNNPPIINNLPDSLIFDETTPAGSLLFTLDPYDADGDPVNVTYTVNPAQYSTKFTLTNSNKLKLTSDVFDYEEQSNFVLEFTVSDDTSEMTSYYLTIAVNDVNEPCVFSPEYYYITMYEGNSGTGTTDPELSVTDEDVGDFYSYSIDQSVSVASTYFSIDPTTGEISFALNYDVDGSHPKSVDLEVVCTDTSGDTGTAWVNVTIEDVNDNVPTFTRVGYIDYISQLDGPATIVRQLNMYMTDLDSGDNAKVEYTWTEVTAGSSNYFHMTARGIVLLTVNAKDYMTYGDVHRFIVTATDKGTPPLASTVVLDIMYRYENTSVTTTVATTTYETVTSFWDSEANIAWVVMGAILGLLLLGLLAFLCYKYCYKKCLKNCCKSAPKKVQVQPKPDPGKNNFDFWNRKDEINEQTSYGNTDIGGVTRYEGGLGPPNVA